MSQQEYAVSTQDFTVLSDFATKVYNYFQSLSTIDQIRAQISQRRKELITPEVSQLMASARLLRKSLKSVTEDTPADAVKQAIIQLDNANKALSSWRATVDKEVTGLRDDQAALREKVKALRVEIPQSFNNSFLMSLVHK